MKASKFFQAVLFLLISGLILSCLDEESNKIETVDEFLTIVCERASLCEGINNTMEEIEMCPDDLMIELFGSTAQIEAFLEYDDAIQDCIIECLATEICDRFSGSILSLSDSDVLEPFSFCDVACQ